MTNELSITVAGLRRGDVCKGSGAVVLDIQHDGLYARDASNAWATPKRPWPRGQSFVTVSYPSSNAVRRVYWRKSTRLVVLRDMVDA